MAMSQAKRKKHVEALKQIIENHGFKEDAYGNFLYPRHAEFRIKFKTNNVVFQIKRLGRWSNLRGQSYVISQVTEDKFNLEVGHKARMIADMLTKKDQRKEAVAKDKEKKGVPLVPALENKETAKEVNALLDKRNHVDYQCYMILRKLKEAGVLDMMYRAHEGEEIDDLISEENIEDILKERVEVNDQLLRKMSGQ